MQNYGSIPATIVQEEQPLLQILETSLDNDDDDEYPEANEEQKELLTLLDGVIADAKNSDIKVDISPLTRQQLGSVQSTTCNSYLTSVNTATFGNYICESWLGAPLFSLMATVVIGVGAIIGIDNSGLVPVENQEVCSQMFQRFVFPGAAAFVGLCGCMRPILSRLSLFSKEVCSFSSPSRTKQAAVEGVENMTFSVVNKLDQVNFLLSIICDGMCSQLEKASKHSSQLREADPTLSIPSNPSDYIQRELRGAKEELRSTALQFSQDLDAAPWIPTYLLSQRAYQYRAATRYWTVFIILHGLGMLGSCYMIEMYFVPSVSLLEDPTGLVAFLEEQSQRLTTPVLFWIVGLSLEPYVISSTLVGIVQFFQLSPKAMITIVNRLRVSVSHETNRLLRQYGITFLCQDILELRMERTRSKLLELIQKRYKLDMLWNILEFDKTTTSTTESSFHSGTSPSKLSVSSGTTATTASSSPGGGWSQTFINWRSATKADVCERCLV